jgi:succinate dehydrogenase/fumarate reductase-like Fe-S protein
VIDRAAFFEGLRELELYIPEQEEVQVPQVLQQSEVHKRLLGCVECLACNATCPEYDFEKNPLAAPYVFSKLAQLHLDPRNVIDRRRQARELGLDGCTECGACRCFHGINIQRDVLKLFSGE